ncbi:MAG: serpin family protein [Polyangiaceae bacterium]|jgi:serpin B|nr:serpin family protein [Polyangiaceae bacterium]MBK8942440.1 serpin family protein [Polyangiaceae bacterium]
MRRRHFLSLLAPLALAACADSSAVPGPGSADSLIPPEGTPELGEPSDEERARFAERSNAFGFDLYKKTAKPGRNVAMSPFSVATALTMTWAGAKGDTEAQMRKVLHLDGAREQLLAEAGKTSAWLQATDRPFKLRGANRLFGDKGTRFEQPYLDDAKRAFGAPLAPLDFRGGADASRAQINRWVEERTEKRIKDLLPDGSVDELTRLVLVNAIYFLADWAQPFEKEATYAAAFATGPSSTKDAPTMHATESYKFAHKDGVKLLELPYKGDTMSMVLLLPDALDGVEALEKALTPEALKAMRAEAKVQTVQIAIPKFEIDPTDSAAFGAALAELGMPDPFAPRKADFTAIANPPSPDERLFISEVFHKAFVKVDEKGTEAAAATAVVMAEAASAAPMPSLTFTADHPFLFFIVDHASSLVLFMGRVADPTSK